eukprot:TRINITY_DN5698_c0_g1_i1.p1 TRINITY_DN5698_c0_g1~~TRINITY_DN5698_c0_g1_i1.p1  ORF type:complete len:376 (+),score=12.69 TRINITY_DN5698_c0_g1_i1:66-1193(+)
MVRSGSFFVMLLILSAVVFQAYAKELMRSLQKDSKRTLLMESGGFSAVVDADGGQSGLPHDHLAAKEHESFGEMDTGHRGSVAAVIHTHRASPVNGGPSSFLEESDHGKQQKKEQRNATGSEAGRARRFLIFTSAGDKSNVGQWLSPDRLYDVVVVYYGNNNFSHDVDELLQRRDTKFPNIHWYLQLHSTKQYEAVAVWDDDIQATPKTINGLFLQMAASGVEIFSPCHTRGNFPCLYKARKTGIRFVDFIEMNAPMFKPRFINDFARSFNDSLKGWGTDVWYAAVCHAQGEKCLQAVSDTFCVTNPTSRADGKREIEKVQPDKIRQRIWQQFAEHELHVSANVPPTYIIRGYDNKTQRSIYEKRRASTWLAWLR